jgi:hypothetical protein
VIDRLPQLGTVGFELLMFGGDLAGQRMRVRGLGVVVPGGGVGGLSPGVGFGLGGKPQLTGHLGWGAGLDALASVPHVLRGRTSRSVTGSPCADLGTPAAAQELLNVTGCAPTVRYIPADIGIRSGPRLTVVSRDVSYRTLPSAGGV